MTDAITPDDAAAQLAEIRQALLAKGVSEALVEKAEGISFWLQSHQSKLEAAYSHCPCYRVDVEACLLSVGDVLLDEWQAKILAALGTWSPDEKTFLLSPHDPSCPESLNKALVRVLAEDACLREIPESQGGSIVDIDEDHVWLLAGVMAMALEADGLHVAQSEGKLVFLAIKDLRRLSAEERQLDGKRGAELILQIGTPVRELFRQINLMLNAQVAADDPEFVEQVLPSLLQDSVVTLERFVNELEICANHARMADSPLAELFSDWSSRYLSRLQAIDADAKKGNAEQALAGLADTGLALEAGLAEQAVLLS